MNQPNLLRRLRNRHSRFIYENYLWHLEDSQLLITFYFLQEPDIRFSPQIRISSTQPILNQSKQVLDRLVFHLGLIELLSYWKAACSQKIVIQPEAFQQETSDFWYELFSKGMGEYFYVNQLDFKVSNFIQVESSKKISGSYKAANLNAWLNDALLMISGGKDSALSASLLQKMDVPFNAMLLNPTNSAWRIAEKAGCQKPIVIQRKIDPALLQLNDKGYLNGHTPFSALLAMLGVISGVLYGYRTVIASNEASCNTPYVDYLGEAINHQYSKTHAFERMFDGYLRHHLVTGMQYLSLLRPLREIQVIGLFSSYPDMLKAFRSCNKNQKKDSWCLQCPKCTALFTLFYPFLQQEQLLEIFGGNLFENVWNLEVLYAILGERDHRPFECIATKEEVLTALHLSIQKHDRNHTPLPQLLQHANTHILPKYTNIINNRTEILFDWNEEHNLPSSWADLLQKKCITAIKKKTDNMNL